MGEIPDCRAGVGPCQNFGYPDFSGSAPVPGHAMQVRQGEVIAGKYVIERVLGEGGMGIVVQATHVHLDERVAIKFLLPHALGNEEAVARFAPEARAALKIKSEHRARVSDARTLDSG